MAGRAREVEDAGAPGFGVGALLLVLTLLFVALRYLGTINHWKLTHWLFAYDLGFVKRGVVGTLVGAIAPGGIVTGSLVVALSLATAALFLAALAALAWPCFARPGRRRALAVGLCALASPGFGYLLCDLGRFDVLGYAIVVGAAVAARAAGRFPLPVFLVLATLLLAIHEASLLTALPVLFVVHLDAEGRLSWLAEPARWPALTARLAPVALVFVGIVVFGSTDLPLRELLARLAERADFRPDPRSAWVLLRGLDSNLAQVWGGEPYVVEGAAGSVLGPIRFDALLGLLPFALAQLALAAAAFHPLPPPRRRAVRTALVLCFLAPLPLLAVGVDWDRWVALAAAHCATLALLFAPELPDECASRLSIPAAVLAAAFVLAAATWGFEMQGSRGDRVALPWTNVERWIEDARGSPTWDRAFVTP